MPSEAIDAISVKGHCYCGAIEFAVNIPPGEDPLFPSCYCHCDSCRRSHAAPLYHVVCIDGESQFEITKGEDHLKKFSKPNARNGITRCFCDVCGTKILNEFNDVQGQSWLPEGVTKPMVFFPNTLSEEDQKNLPEAFRPKSHNCKEECVLDMDVLRAIGDPAEKTKWEKEG